MRPPKPSLRKNKPTRRGKPGSYKLRLTLLVDPRKKGKLVELGLGTNDRQEAEERANSIINALESAGLYRLPAVRILEHHVAQFGKTEEKIDGCFACGYGTWKNSWQNIPHPPAWIQRNGLL